MNKIIMLAILLAVILNLSCGQRWQGGRKGEGMRQEEQPLRRRDQNRPPHPRERKPKHQIEEEVGANTIAQDQKGSNQTENATKQQLGGKRQGPHQQMEKPDKPLIKLIFILLGALLIITFILLLKFIARREENQIQPKIMVQHIEYSKQVQRKVYPQMQLEGQIKMQKQRLRHLEKLKEIKEKYLITSFTSNNELVKCHDISKEMDDQPSTPVFATPFTFREASMA